MLKAKALKRAPRFPFVCSLCRLELVSTHVRSQPLRCWAVRQLSSTSSLRQVNDGADPRGFGNFSKTLRSASSSSDGLLPHERAARQRAARSAKPTEQTQSPVVKPDVRRSDRPKPKPPRSESHEAHARRSRSVLADVFRSTRQPQSPPTPKSWSSPSDSQKPGTNDAAQLGATTDITTRAEAAPRSQGRGTSSHQRPGAHDSRAQPPGGAPKQIGWGSFSHRKAQTSTHGHAHGHGVGHGNESTLWSEITRSKRQKPKPHAKSRLAGGTTNAQAAELPSEAAQPEADFWGELETRVGSLKETKGKGRRESAEALGALSRRIKEKSSKDIDDSSSNRGAASSGKAGPWPSERRRSRFERDEPTNTADKKSGKSKKASKPRRRDQEEDWDDEAAHRWEQRLRKKAAKEKRKAQVQEEQQAVPIFLPEYISASNLAQALGQRADRFLSDMEEMGFENVTPDTIMTGETAALISMEYGFEPTVDSGSQRDLRPRAQPEDVASLPGRPPVVTIMGHVDHGKTTLLDWLRKSSVAAQEHGGITQHIGAFVVRMSSGKEITFLDTPGHAAFLSMRQRGANVTDIVVLVVAADDSVMPQTIEAIKHATSAKVPIIVAINKIDKEDARVDQVKADLARHGVEIEDYGGDVQVVCVSGKTGQGMPDLEENIITLSEILDVRAESDGMAEGWVLESSIKTNGKVATVLVKRGTLRPGDLVVAGRTWARVRVLRNEAGVEIDEAPPGTPVEVMGWRDLPDAGEQVLQAPDEAKAKTAVEYRLEMAEREDSSAQLAEQEQRQRERAAAEAAATDTAETATDAQQESSEPGVLYQNFTVRADVVGSVEAVCGSILELGNHEVQPKILRSSAGQISEYDIDHAAASSSVIVNFNVPVLPHIKQRAQDAKVKILDHNVIYHVVDDVKSALTAMLPMNVSYRVSGEADILQVFPINVKKRVFRNIAGCRVRNGSIKKSSLVKVLRKGKVVFDGKIDTLKHVKKDVMEMGKGAECGIGLEGFEGFQVDDQIQTYEEVRERRTL